MVSVSCGTTECNGLLRVDTCIDLKNEENAIVLDGGGDSAHAALFADDRQTATAATDEIFILFWVIRDDDTLLRPKTDAAWLICS